MYCRQLRIQINRSCLQFSKLCKYYEFCLLFDRQMDNEIMRFNGNSPRQTSGAALDVDVVCSDYSYLNEQQLSICRKYPTATASAVQGRTTHK